MTIDVREMMHAAEDLDTAVLHSLRVKGRAEPTAVAAAVAAGEDAVVTALERAAAEGLAVRRTGRLSGWLLTPQGRERWDGQCAAERERLDTARATELYDSRFLALNSEFKQLCARSQLSGAAPGDEGAVAAAFEKVHRSAGEVIGGFAALLPRFALYRPRLDAAIGRYRSGDAAALLQPFTDSYHDIWLELHEDLLLLLGKEREEND